MVHHSLQHWTWRIWWVCQSPFRARPTISLMSTKEEKVSLPCWQIWRETSSTLSCMLYVEQKVILMLYTKSYAYQELGMKLRTKHERRRAMHVHSDIHPVRCLNRKISV